jgi:Ser/Thr protein kinase RdoA (MazF antagonist)
MPEHEFDWVPTDAQVAEAFAHLDVPAADEPKEFRGSFNRVFHYTDAEGRCRVLRLRPKWLTERRVRFEHALANHLAGQGVPVLPPVLLHGGGTWMKVGDCYAEVYPFVAGREGHPVAQDAYLSGAVLAQFHRGSLSLDRSLYESPKVGNQLGALELLSMLEELNAPAARDEPLASLLPRAQPTLDCARSRVRELYARDGGGSLPATMRHGDPHIWNFLYSDEEPPQVLTLLDLDMAAEGPRIFDVNYALYFLVQSTASGYDPPSRGGAWRPLCGQFMRGYAGSTDIGIVSAEAAVASLQMHCVALHFLYWDIMRMANQNGLAVACQRYRSIAGWLDEHEAELSEVVAGG